MIIYVLQILYFWLIIFTGFILAVIYNLGQIMIISVPLGFLFRYNALSKNKNARNIFTNILSLVSVLILIPVFTFKSFFISENLYLYILISSLLPLVGINIFFDITNVKLNYYKNKKLRYYLNDFFRSLNSTSKNKITKIPTISIIESVNYNYDSIDSILKKLLLNIPLNYFQGIGNINILNSSDLNRSRKKTKIKSFKKIRIQESYGMYHPKFKGRKPYIELFVDNIFENYQRQIFRIPILKDLIFAHTLFHELGHHINYYQKPERRNQEIIANEWSEYLSLQYITKRYWILLILFWSPMNIYKLSNYLIDIYRIET